MPESLDNLEDAADCLEKHEGIYMLLAPGSNGKTFRCSRIRSREELDYFRREFEAYLQFWDGYFKSPPETSPQ